MKKCFDCKYIKFCGFATLICEKNLPLKNSKNCKKFEKNITIKEVKGQK